MTRHESLGKGLFGSFGDREILISIVVVCSWVCCCIIKKSVVEDS
jgi:hypothetical protein